MSELGQRTFTMADQEWFAAMSGDANPVHVDPIAARRTLVGGPLVHGVHLLLWALDRAATRLPNVARVRATLARPVLVGDRVEVREVVDDDGTQIQVVGVGGEVKVVVNAEPGPMSHPGPTEAGRPR